MDTVHFMGCDYFKHLHQGENAKYKSQRIISEFLQVMAHQIEKKRLQDLLSASFYSIMIDETTDIAVLNEMVLYARYLSPRDKKVTLSFLKICQLGNGLATTIESTLLAYFEEKGIAVANMVGFGSDGVRVMTGRNNGVGAKLKQRQPSLTCVHCVCHRLALAASHAGKDVPYIRLKFKPTLSQLFYFYQNSSVRMSGLQAIERLLQSPELKLKKPADTRWLSHDSACQTLVKVFPAVCFSLSREAQERGDALALGLSKVVRMYNFIATLYMMCDVLPVITRLSCKLQTASIDLSSLHSLVQCTVQTLQLLRDFTGVRLNSLDADFDDSLSECGITVTAELKQQFHTTVYVPFLESLLCHVQERLPDTGVFAAFSILDPSKLPASVEDVVSLRYGQPAVQTLEQQYCCGDVVSVTASSIKAEWQELRIYLCGYCRSKSMADILQLLIHNPTLQASYPNFSKLAHICQTLPIHTADCERAFSTMRRVKGRLRSEMTNSTLNHCMRISIEGPTLEEFNFNESVDSWGNLKNRRIAI